MIFPPEEIMKYDQQAWLFSTSGLRSCPLSGQRTSLLPVAPTSEQMQLEKGWMWAEVILPFPILDLSALEKRRSHRFIRFMRFIRDLGIQPSLCFPGALTDRYFPCFPQIFSAAGNVSATARRFMEIPDFGGGYVFQTFVMICFDPLWSCV